MTCQLLQQSELRVGETDTFRSIKYKPVKSALSELMDWRMDIVSGPGLSYHPDDLLAPTTSAESVQLVAI